MKNKKLNIYIARDNLVISEDDENYLHKHPEDKYLYAKLHVFYNIPLWNGDKWYAARDMFEAPNYMFPQIKSGECIKFCSEQLIKKLAIRL